MPTHNGDFGPRSNSGIFYIDGNMHKMSKVTTVYVLNMLNSPFNFDIRQKIIKIKSDEKKFFRHTSIVQF